MIQLNAFVGHSFAAEDHVIVEAFLKYFTQIKNMDIGFAWETAEGAEPKDLAEKVMRVIADKNLFIGICTKRETAIDAAHLSKWRFRKKILKAPEEQFVWKASDWVIQEIGLAIGRDMDLILLVESGLRRPGGLQGDLEYIPFERNAPEKSFGKLLEMIQALRPKAKPLPMTETDARVSSEERVVVEDTQNWWWLAPQRDWNMERYESALLRAIVTENGEGERKIIEAFLVSEFGQDSANGVRWEALSEHIKLRWGKGGKLSKLEELATNNPDNSDLQSYLGLGYLEFDEYAKAGQCFLDSANHAENTRKQLARYGDAAFALARAGLPDSANDSISKMRLLVPTVPAGEHILLGTLRKMAEFYKDKDLLFGACEHILQLHPDDLETRFSLAHQYSEAHQEELSLFHYLKIPYQEREVGAWNNLGVQFDQCNLPGKSVDAYRKAEEQGETLAMSNLAQKFVKSGFLKEADEICNRAIKIDGYHQNVSHAISRIKAVPGEEQSKENQLLEKSKPISDFYRDYGRAVAQKEVIEHTGRWRSLDCELQLTVKGNEFLATGTYEVPRSGAGLQGLLLGLTAAPPAKDQYSVRYSGKISGHAGEIDIIREELNKTSFSSTFLTGTDSRKKAVIVISETLKEIRIAEKDSSNKLTFHTLTRLN